MRVNPVELLSVKKLQSNPNNPKKPMGRRFSRGLEASLKEYGFSGIFNVAANADGTHEVLDGNTRVEILDAAGVKDVPCVVHADMAEGNPGWREKRDAFVLSYDRNRKVYDEDAVLDQLKSLANRGQDVAALGVLTATDNLKQLIGESKAATSAAMATMGKVVVQSSLMLYGPAEDIEAVKELLKRIRGRLGPVFKMRSTLEQADAFMELEDEQFLVCFAAAIQRFQEQRERE